MNESKTTKAYFKFNNIPGGEYAIKCFQDLNNNKKIDMGLFGPKEPYGFYLVKKDVNKPPGFDDLSFLINKNINDIIITLR